MVQIKGSGPALTESQIQTTEGKLKVVLPPDFKSFLFEHNGGRPTPNAFTFISNKNDGSLLSWFYGIYSGNESNDLLGVASRREGRLPDGFVAIGQDPGSNEICLSCKLDANYGKVFFWDHEREADPNQGITPETAGNIDLIANSFSEFLASLHDAGPIDDSVGALVEDDVLKARFEALKKRRRQV